ncbi:MAG: hypothetical protein FJX76_21160 [Armatimonadetes bacterium]|nr:hypothetical protein [Armatimonadota bacterium]
MTNATPNGGTITASEPLAVDPEKVLQTLTKAWQQRATVGGGDAIVRAATLNLLIFSQDPNVSQLIDDVLSEIVEKHPLRAITVIAQPKAPESAMRAWTQVHTTALNGGVRQLCCEQVTIDARGDAVDGLEGAVLPLIDPELPVYLWWRGDPPFEGSFFERLVGSSDYMIFDSADFREPDEDLAWVGHLVKDQPFDIAYSDVNWARLTPWQALTAQFFDGLEFRPCLDAISDVRIEYVDDNFGSRVSAQAWLLLGWLASRLGWRPVSAPASGEDGVVTVRLQRGENPITVTLQRESVEGDAFHGVIALQMVSTGQTSANFRVEYLGDSQCARTIVRQEGAPSIERVVNMDEPSEAFLIGREFESPGRDALYADALRAAVAISMFGQ